MGLEIKKEYIYKLCVYDSRDPFCNRDLIGIFTEDVLDDLKFEIESNACDLHEGCFDYVFIEKVQLNHLYSFWEEIIVYNYIGDNTYKYIGTYNGNDEINLFHEKYNIKK